MTPCRKNKWPSSPRQGRESAKDIAEVLSLSTGTVYTYFKRIKAKTGWSKQGLALEAGGAPQRICPSEPIEPGALARASPTSSHVEFGLGASTLASHFFTKSLFWDADFSK